MQVVAHGPEVTIAHRIDPLCNLQACPASGQPCREVTESLLTGNRIALYLVETSLGEGEVGGTGREEPPLVLPEDTPFMPDHAAVKPGGFPGHRPYCEHPLPVAAGLTSCSKIWFVVVFNVQVHEHSRAGIVRVSTLAPRGVLHTLYTLFSTR